MSIFKWNHAGLFVGGMLAATKGVELIKSEKAHDCFVKATALALRGRDDIMSNVAAVREGCEDIYAEALDYNEDLSQVAKVEVEVIEDKSKSAMKKGTGSTAKKATKKATK